MLNIHPEMVCFIIAKAYEFQSKEEVVIPEIPNSPSDDWALQVLADHIDDMTFQEVKTLIDDLSLEQKAELEALMWLGRGDYDLVEWEEAVEAAQDEMTDRTTEYLLAHPFVAEHLEEGLLHHGYNCER